MRDRVSVPTHHQWEMTYGKSNGHVNEIEDGGLTEVFTVWVLFSSICCDSNLTPLGDG